MRRLSNLLSDRGRKIAGTIFFVLFGASVVANVLLLTKTTEYKLNQPLYPICFTRADGFVVMRSASRKFIRELATTLPDTRWHHYNKAAYVTKSYWHNRQGQIWNATRDLAEYMHFKRTGERVTEANFRKLKTNSCPFIRKYSSQ